MRKETDLRKIKKQTFAEELQTIFNEHTIRYRYAYGIDGREEVLKILMHNAHVDTVVLCNYYGEWNLALIFKNSDLIEVVGGCFSFGYNGQGANNSMWLLNLLGFKETVPTDSMPSNSESTVLIFER